MTKKEKDYNKMFAVIYKALDKLDAELCKLEDKLNKTTKGD